jgi:Helix-turn-helix domain
MTERTLDTSPPDLGAFTVTKFAAMFSLSRGMVYKLAREKKIRFAKINNKTVITVGEARRFQRTLELDAA